MSQMRKKRTKIVKMSATRVIAVVFALIIFVGAVLLMLPVASRDGQSAGWLTALFTSTSCTCVTGLVLVDTWTQWSGFGQIVLLCLIELGGLGFMSVASLVIFTLRKKVGLRQRMLMAQALSVNEMESVVRLQKWVLGGSLTIQLVGALILFARFLYLDYGWAQSAKWSIFHAISAFCNAGFDITGNIQPGANMIVFNQDPVILITLMALIVLGGLGFFVWDEVVRVHNFRKFSVYTKLVLLCSLVLIVGGAFFIALLEWNNPETLGTMDAPHKILNAFFQSVTVRTAGFTGVDQAALTEGGKAVSIFLMLIGGASGSTAGGIKMVTILVLAMYVIAKARGKSTVTAFKRTIPHEKIMDAATITVLVVSLAFAGAVFIVATSPVSFVDAFFETASALATVGLTTGLTPGLTVAAKLMLIVFMYFGRVGILTISLGFLTGNTAEERIRYANTNLLIG